MGALTVCECAHPLNPFNPWLIHSGAKLVRNSGSAMSSKKPSSCRFRFESGTGRGLFEMFPDELRRWIVEQRVVGTEGGKLR